MDIQAAKQVAREAAEDVIPRIGKADLLCGICREREPKAGSRNCRECIETFEIY
jgi:hypothetical protein